MVFSFILYYRVTYFILCWHKNRHKMKRISDSDIYPLDLVIIKNGLIKKNIIAF